jgi:hypothetical protein
LGSAVADVVMAPLVGVVAAGAAAGAGTGAGAVVSGVLWPRAFFGFSCGLAGVRLAGGAVCAQTAAAGNKSKRARAILCPGVRKTVIFVIMQGIPQFL